jgi:hypothetical protein
MNERIGIVLGGLIAAFVAIGLIEIIFTFTEGIFAGRLIAIATTLITTGILYALTYVSTQGRDGELSDVAAGVFAGAVGAILSWAIGESLFGPFALTGLVVAALIGGLLFSLQIDPKVDF